MGITIHYKGKLNSPEFIDSFCEEVEDIVQSMEWEYTAIDEHEDHSANLLKGFFIQPHEKSEYLQLVVDLQGNLRNGFWIDHFKNNDSASYFNHIKTQFAPIEIHIAVIKLFKYLQQKYISNLEVYDEGDYWQTGDAEILQKKFNVLNAAMDQMEDLLNSISIDKNESKESVLNKIEEVLNKLKKNK